MKKLTFSKSAKLKSNEQFRQVFAERNRCGDKLLIVYRRPNGLDIARLGVSIGKACGNAVARNRLKRLIREAFRLNSDTMGKGFDYVVIANPAIKDNLENPVKKLKLTDVEKSLFSLIKKLNKLNANS